jgi:hypothetical protein
MSDRIIIHDQDGTELLSIRKTDARLPATPQAKAVTWLEAGCCFLAGLSIGLFLVVIIYQATP